MEDIQIITKPEDIANLVNASPRTSNTPAESGASVNDILAQIEKDAMSKEDQQKALDQLREKSKPKVKPLQLKYTYEGNHSCGNTVKTIMINAGEKLIASGYCLNCDETVSQIEVQPINNPKIEPIPEPATVPEVVKTVPTNKDVIMAVVKDAMMVKKVSK